MPDNQTHVGGQPQPSNSSGTPSKKNTAKINQQVLMRQLAQQRGTSPATSGRIPTGVVTPQQTGAVTSSSSVLPQQPQLSPQAPFPAGTGRQPKIPETSHPQQPYTTGTENDFRVPPTQQTGGLPLQPQAPGFSGAMMAYPTDGVEDMSQGIAQPQATVGDGVSPQYQPTPTGNSMGQFQGPSIGESEPVTAPSANSTDKQGRKMGIVPIACIAVAAIALGGIGGFLAHGNLPTPTAVSPASKGGPGSKVVEKSDAADVEVEPQEYAIAYVTNVDTSLLSPEWNSGEIVFDNVLYYLGTSTFRDFEANGWMLDASSQGHLSDAGGQHVLNPGDSLTMFSLTNPAHGDFAFNVTITNTSSKLAYWEDCPITAVYLNVSQVSVGQTLPQIILPAGITLDAIPDFIQATYGPAEIQDYDVVLALNYQNGTAQHLRFEFDKLSNRISTVSIQHGATTNAASA